jgi:mRNA-degrading endonuclease RelE of RelBE toxin-antitoxin system
MTNTKVDFTKRFNRDLGRLERKYPQVADEVESLVTRLKENERPGDKIPGVGYDVYKVRLGNPSAGRGKRGGFRVIYYIRWKDSVILLALYVKTQREDIPPEQIRRIIEEYDAP